jgi:hypothetical protein
MGNDGVISFYRVVETNSSVETKTLASFILKYGNKWDAVQNLLLGLPSDISPSVDKNNMRLIAETAHALYTQQSVTPEIIDRHFEILYGISNESKLYKYP